jgi:hypothetical protein
VNDDNDERKLPSLPKKPSSDGLKLQSYVDKETARLLPLFATINPLSSVIVKVLFNDKKVFGFPIMFRQFLRDETSFCSFDEIHDMIANRADDALVSRHYVPVFKDVLDTNYGASLDLRLDSMDPDLGECHLSEMYYVESICASYHEHGKIILNLHCPRSPFYDNDPKIAMFTPTIGQQTDHVKMEQDGLSGDKEHM